MPSEVHPPDEASRDCHVAFLLSLLITFFLYCDSYLCYMSMPSGMSSSGFHIFLVWIGVFLAQPALLAVWAAFGTEPFAVRMPRALFLTCLVSLSFTYGTWLNMSGQLGASDVAATLLPITQFLFAFVAFWFLKKLLGWRIIGPHRGREDRSRHRTRFSMLRLLIWQSLSAIVLFLASLLFRGSEFDTREALLSAIGQTLMIGGFYGLFSLSIAFNVAAVLGTTHRIRYLVAAFCSAIAFFSLAIFLTWRTRVTGAVSSKEIVAFTTALVAFHTSVFGSLQMVRILGYRLVRNSGAEEADVTSTESAHAWSPLSSFAVVAVTLLVLFLATLPFVLQLQEDRSVQRANLEGIRQGYTVSERADGGTQIDYFPNQPPSAKGLAKLSQLPGLTCARFTSTQIRDDQLQVVGKLANLETLFLDATPITDSGLQHLKNLKNLRALYLKNSLVTSEGVDQLQKALPKCVIDIRPMTSEVPKTD